MEPRDRYAGCLAGLAVGDAVGTAVEFKPRGSFPPLTDMVGGGTFQLSPGQWTDDTSMALCLGASLLECSGFDAADQMTRYLRWVQQGYFSSTGKFVDVGMTVAEALVRFEQTGDPFSGSTADDSAGNGCIMRLAPVPLFYYPDREAIWRYAAESARTTHGAAECLDACRLFGDILYRALAGHSKHDVLFGAPLRNVASPRLRAIAEGSYASKTEPEISGSSYVVRSLEAALWCFLTEGTFDEVILRAVNLGEDADTTAAVAGQLAGAFYGAGAIRASWLEKLELRDEILSQGTRLGMA
jgi:ADP-ribosyl-[dinitrogen reductase] hydrolase